MQLVGIVRVETGERAVARKERIMRKVLRNHLLRRHRSRLAAVQVNSLQRRREDEKTDAGMPFPK